MRHVNETFSFLIETYTFFVDSTLTLNGTGQFKKFERSMLGIDEFYCHFHPTEPVLACTGVNKVILLSADNSSIPFSNWKEKETKLELAHFEYTATMEWNVSGAFEIFELTLYRQTIEGAFVDLINKLSNGFHSNTFFYYSIIR
jgi:hypothetical protein